MRYFSLLKPFSTNTIGSLIIGTLLYFKVIYSLSTCIIDWNILRDIEKMLVSYNGRLLKVGGLYQMVN